MAEVTAVTACMTCGWGKLKGLLDLGSQPLAERDDGCRYPLALLECTMCGLVQISHVVDRAEVFPADHPYATGNTAALREHFAALAREVAPLVSHGQLIVDIGANDGTFLAEVGLAAPGARLLAVEPTGQALRCERRGIPVVWEFFSYRGAREILRQHGRAAVITASNVLAHAGDQHDFMSAVSMLLAADGVFITENHDWASVVNGLQIDTVYHEHLRYYSPATLGRLLETHGFLVSRTDTTALHGGSFRTWAVRQAPALQERAGRARDQIRAIVAQAADQGPVYGIGAATRATPLIHYAGLDTWLDRVCEVPGSDKIGSMIPGTSVPVVDESELIASQPPHAVLLCWHIGRQVAAKLREAGYRGQFIVPLPRPAYLADGRIAEVTTLG